MSLKVDYQVHRTSVNLSKGYRQIEKAATALSRGNADSAANHLDKALSDFVTAVDHAAKAEDDACNQAGNDIDKGNAELQKCITASADGHPDIAAGHYDSAVASYDKALDLIDA
jgi:tetratricopeptide (TPR) repeat protein